MNNQQCCPDCGVCPGELHWDYCDVEPCRACGGQWLKCYAGCGCDGPRWPRVPWAGDWPGIAECREWGWYVRLVPGRGWVPCGPDEPGAKPDLDRLHAEADWDAGAGRFVRAEDFERLKARLLSLGGQEVLAQAEPDANDFLTHGRVFAAEGSRRVPGEGPDCHDNAALHYLNCCHKGVGDACDLATGYGLRGGVWSPHTWLWDGARVLETTAEMELYFGLALPPVDAARFVLTQVEQLLPGSAEFCDCDCDCDCD